MYLILPNGIAAFARATALTVQMGRLHVFPSFHRLYVSLTVPGAAR